MLPKAKRINLSRRSKYIGKRFNTNLFDLIYKKSQHFEAAAVISKTVAKLAVDRNRSKRLIMEAVREKNLKGEFIFIVKTNLKDFKKNEIAKNIDDVFQKINF